LTGEKDTIIIVVKMISRLRARILFFNLGHS
jgi:hypothetical protein